ncbi:MAG: hypothetical protein ACK4SM_07500 [Aquificaceae bacterium]
MKNVSFDVHLLEEVSNLEYFIVKSPINTPEFWKEWQEKFSRAYMSKTAMRKILRSRRLSYDDLGKYKVQMNIYEDVLSYLETLKNLALSLRGILSSDQSTELDDEDTDLDI